MADRAHELTDKEIAKIQRHIAGIYKAAQKDVDKELSEYADAIREKSNKLLKAVSDAADENTRKSAENAYKRFYLIDVKKDKRFIKAARKSSERLYEANKNAVQYINTKTAHIYAANYNQIGEGLQADLDGYQFKPVSDGDAEMYGHITQQNVDKEKDTSWNTKNIITAVAAGAILLKGADRIFKDTAKSATRKNKESGNRQANDVLTDAESKGRLDSMYKASDEGFDVKKQWICVHDNRTRETHILYNDLGRVDLDYEFADGLKRPKDSNCLIKEEVCNCRCTLDYVAGKRNGGREWQEEAELQKAIKSLQVPKVAGFRRGN